MIDGILNYVRGLFGLLVRLTIPLVIGLGLWCLIAETITWLKSIIHVISN